MVEVLQFLFATDRDQFLYQNQEQLINELINDYDFSELEIKQALEWFAPIPKEHYSLVINPNSMRGISNWEVKHVPKAVISKILEWEHAKQISSVEREILLDRFGELCLEFQLAIDDAQEILEGLIYHIQNYLHEINFNLPQSPYFWETTNTLQ